MRLRRFALGVSFLVAAGPLALAVPPSSAAAVSLKPNAIEVGQPVSPDQTIEAAPGEQGEDETSRLARRDRIALDSLLRHEKGAPVPDLVIAPPAAQGAGKSAEYAQGQRVPQPAFLAASTITSIQGIDFDASGATKPDTQIAKSGQRILEATNGQVRLFDNGGSALQSLSMSSFFGTTSPTTDPRVLFDGNALNTRFILAVLDSANFANHTSRLRFAISRSANPSDLGSGSWCFYNLDAIVNVPEQTYADFTGLGLGADALVITTNQYRFTANQSPSIPATVMVRAFKKLPLENNATSCPAYTVYSFQAGPLDDRNTATLQPAQHFTSPSSFVGTTNPVYLVSTKALDAGQTLDGLWRVWRLRNVGSGSPTLDVFDLVVWGYVLPLSASQPGGQSIATLDTRIHQVAARGDSLWAVQSTLCEYGSGGTGDCVQIARLDVSQGANGLPTASFGYHIVIGGGPDFFYWMPGIAVNASLWMGVGFLYSSANTYLSSAWIDKSPAAPDWSWSPAQIIRSGLCATGAQSGDYVGAQVDPSDSNTFWFAAQGAAPNAHGSCQWKTTIAQALP